MISEGTDIPRLQVCCHMSSIKTELYFRQVLGRILRVNGLGNQQAWLFTFAEPSLIEFSEQVEQDLPTSCTLTKVTNSAVYEIKTPTKTSDAPKLCSGTERTLSQLKCNNQSSWNSSPQELNCALN